MYKKTFEQPTDTNARIEHFTEDTEDLIRRQEELKPCLLVITIGETFLDYQTIEKSMNMEP
jgi:hypothetical protein